jgi:hypothetical protein
MKPFPFRSLQRSVLTGVPALLACILAAADVPVDESGPEAFVAAVAPGGGGGAAEMARKLQNPLANIRALMTDNAIGFNTGNDNGTSFGFQLQPVYAIDLPDQGITLLPRGVIPILGLEPGTDTPLTGQPVTGGGSSVWGVGDIVLQGFVAPHVESKWKWGLGPQFSLGTATDYRLSGPNWGAGLAGVVTGDITPEISFSGILGNLWSFDGKFNTMTIQPMVYYNIPSMPGAYIAYNAVIAIDWEASSNNTLTLPLGVTVGKTFDLGQGNGLDVGVGPYINVIRPDGAADWQIRFGISWLFP